jgi:hypothetical protein
MSAEEGDGGNHTQSKIKAPTIDKATERAIVRGFVDLDEEGEEGEGVALLEEADVNENQLLKR